MGQGVDCSGIWQGYAGIAYRQRGVVRQTDYLESSRPTVIDRVQYELKTGIISKILPR